MAIRAELIGTARLHASVRVASLKAARSHCCPHIDRLPIGKCLYIVCNVICGSNLFSSVHMLTLRSLRLQQDVLQNGVLNVSPDTFGQRDDIS